MVAADHQPGDHVVGDLDEVLGGQLGRVADPGL